MLFSSAAFLYSFLPLTIAVYFLMPRRLKNAALLLMSLIFYAWGEPRYVVLMVLSITQGYIFARLIGKSRGTKRAKAYLIISLVLSLGMLGVFKYANFFAESFAAVFGLKIAALNIALPIGISFYTFQLISYVIDVYRADVEPQRDYVAFAAYISMFPQLIAGPIVRYSDIEAELTARAYGANKAAYGARRFILGLGKKVLIANVLAELVNAFKASGEKSTLFYWVYAAAYMLHVYFDFSGYSDMAIGLGSIFGFTFPENFNYPYIAASITEFWRRWHMSLSSWFRDYVYIMYSNRIFSDMHTDPARKLIWYGGYLEGWALYVEFLSYDYAATLLEQAGQSDAAQSARLEKHTRSLQLCMYTLLDLLIHGEGAGYDQVAEVLGKFGIDSPGTCEAIYTYIAEEPCNYPKYYIGYLEILQLQDTARSHWKDAYSDLRFHTFYLEQGTSDFSSLGDLLLMTN